MKTIGNAQEVVDAFIDGRVMRTPLTHVPGGRRVSVAAPYAVMVELHSYNTIIAVRVTEGGETYFATTTRRYSVTTSKLLGRVARRLYAEGYRPTEETVPVAGVKIPGRWGGYGPAWAPADWETVRMTVWRSFS